MAHYAFLNDENIVTEVITGKDETELLDGVTPEEWYSNFRGQRCIRTSYNSNIRGIFATVGDSYIEEEDIFATPQPYPSWNRVGSYWYAPIERPKDENRYEWNEEEGSWNVIS